MLIKDLEIRFKELQKASKLLELCSSIHEGDKKNQLIQDLYDFLGWPLALLDSEGRCTGESTEHFIWNLEPEVDPQIASELCSEDQEELLAYEEILRKESFQ